MKTIKIALLSIAAMAITGAAFAGTIALWNYNSGNLLPSMGSGTMALRGGLPAAPSKYDTDLGDFDPTRTENNSSDPAPIAMGGTPLQSRGYRVEWGKVSDTSGVWNPALIPGAQAIVWKVSTVGYSNIHCRVDVRQKSYNTKYFQLQYTTDGTNWVTYPKYFGWDLPQEQASWFNHCDIDLSSIPAANNNPNFAFAFIMSYGPGGANYSAVPWPAPGGSTAYPRYGFDMAEVYSGTSSVVDTKKPEIRAIYVTRPQPDQTPVAGNWHVRVWTSDNAVVNTVTANGVSLTRTGLYIWEANIPTPGNGVVNVVSTDDSGNSTTASQNGLSIVAGVCSKHVSLDEWGGETFTPIMLNSCYKMLFKAFGKVTKIDSNWFTITDQYGGTWRILAPGWEANAHDGGWAAASGMLVQSTVSDPAITSDVSLVSDPE